jgi:UDP-2-acetamido-2,6-beta-L-arabino-hexul-4-ose reductase
MEMKIRIIETVSDSDERGFLSLPITDEQVKSIYNFHIVSLKPGHVRGNHYHRHQTEYICVLGGQSKFLAVDNKNKEKTELVLDGNKCPLITVPPFVTHAVKNIGNETVYLLCYTDKPFNPDKRDMVKDIILD